MEIPAMLSAGGCEVDVYCHGKKSWALQNRFYRKHIQAASGEQEFTSGLLDFVTRNGDAYNWIIPGDDVIIRMLNDVVTDPVLFRKIMPLTQIANRRILGSKAGFSTICEQFNILTPRFMIYKEGMNAREIADYMKFPLLIKVDQSEGGYGVFKCDNQEEMEKRLASVVKKENLVFQQFIKGYDVNVEVLYRDGHLLVYNYSKTTRIMGQFGVSTQRLFYPNNEVESELLRIGKEVGLSGFGNVVFMFNELDRKHYLIEIDLRPNAWMHYGRFTGNDFSVAIRKMVNGDLSLLRQTPPVAPVPISLYKKDMHRCILEKDFKTIFSWMFNRGGCWKYVPFYDWKLLRACNRFLADFFWEMASLKWKKITGRRTA